MLLASAFSPLVSADVRVEFVEPQRYTDAGRYGSEQDRTLRSTEHHLRALGKRCLTEGETLEIRVHNIDLAGRHEGWRPQAYDVRFMREVTWPRMDLEFDWRDAGGTLLAQGRERVSDMNYLSRSAYVRFASDPLVYDKAMLTDWFERRFCRGSG